jgi:hypothetical protein
MTTKAGIVRIMPFVAGLVFLLMALVWLWRAQTIGAVASRAPLGKVMVEAHLLYDKFWGVCTPGMIACGPVMEPPFETYIVVLGMLLAISVISWIVLRSLAGTPSRSGVVVAHQRTAPARGMKHCISCGVGLPINARFCDNCGTQQPQDS